MGATPRINSVKCNAVCNTCAATMMKETTFFSISYWGMSHGFNCVADRINRGDKNNSVVQTTILPKQNKGPACVHKQNVNLQQTRELDVTPDNIRNNAYQCHMMHTVRGFGEVEKYAHSTFSSLQTIDNIMNRFSYGIDGRCVFPKPERFRTENFEAIKELFKLIDESFSITLLRSGRMEIGRLLFDEQE
ncbi:hypothetical protein J6590_078112 [Homalodisca vitripennis]|nr:hypothetical protein J6590_078112 [Homalodisca vitripennis]